MRFKVDGEYWLAVIMPCDLDWRGFHGSEKMVFLVLVLGLQPRIDKGGFRRIKNVTDGLDGSGLSLDRR